MELSNITIRKCKSRSFANISTIVDEYNLTDVSSCFNASTHSLPNTSITENEYTKKLQEQINYQKSEIESANEEIENLSLENMELKKSLEQLKKTLSLLKKINISKTMSSPIQSPSLNTTPSKHILNSPNRYITQVINLEKYIKSLEKQLEESKSLIEKLNDTINNLQCSIAFPATKNDTNICHKTYVDNALPSSTQTSMIREKNEKHCVKSVISEKTRRKVIIIADQQGKGVRRYLQNLIGEDFLVTCLWKPGAKMGDLLSSYKQELQTLTKLDYVILLGGSNDKNPIEFQYNLEKWLNCIINTNILICEIPYNKLLNEKKLNYELRFICNRYKNSFFVDMGFEQFIPYKSFFSTFISRSLLKEILRLEYQQKINAYHAVSRIRVLNSETPKVYFSKSTQTDFICKNDCSSPKLSADIVSNNLDELFR